MSQDAKRNSESIAGKLIAAGFPADLDSLQFSAALNQWQFAPGGGAGLTFARVIKTADEIVNNSNVPQDDDQLFFNVNINKIYSFLFTFFTNANSEDMRFALSLPAGATAKWAFPLGIWGRIIGSIDTQDATANLDVTSYNGTDDVFGIVGMIDTGATAGLVNLQWAQRITTPVNTTLLTGSTLLVWESA